MEYFGLLPVDISLHIFGLLPVESVSDFALVSKSWKNLIHSPSFYKMHKVRLLRLAREAHAENGQKLKEFNEYCEFAKQFALSCQSEEIAQQFHKMNYEYVEEKMNSVRLSQQKLDHFIRLAKKCGKIWEKSKDISSTETEGIRKMLTSKQQGVVKSIISDLGKLCDADKVVAAKEPGSAAASLDLHESSSSHLSDKLSVVETNKQRIVEMETSAIRRTSGPAFCRPVRRLIDFWFDLVLGRGLGER